MNKQIDGMVDGGMCIEEQTDRQIDEIGDGEMCIDGQTDRRNW